MGHTCSVGLLSALAIKGGGGLLDRTEGRGRRAAGFFGRFKESFFVGEMSEAMPGMKQSSEREMSPNPVRVCSSFSSGIVGIRDGDVACIDEAVVRDMVRDAEMKAATTAKAVGLLFWLVMGVISGKV